MTRDADIGTELQETVRTATARGTALHIRGGGTKDFYGRQINGQALDVGKHRGILAHEPTELVITARAGTPLAEIETALAEKNQMLAFEPPAFGPSATLGGTIACGFSGPRRPWSGSARDFVLGAKILNGHGEILRFGGQVMKNVAGFDVSRLMVGALGTLGVLLDISLKVLPRPEAEQTLAFALPPDRAIAAMNEWSRQPLPLSAAAHVGDTLYIRISGAGSALRAARARLGGEPVEKGDELWRELNEQQRQFFEGRQPLWRLSVPPATPHMALPGKWLIDWGGAQRWLKTDAPATDIQRAAETAGGHATLFRGGDRNAEVFHPLPQPLAALHRRLKQSFDPAGILNPGRLYAGL
ncbi:MAG: glycolate oxidase subunit GlcE [Gammaproteobacteria bacterium]|nr:MAG: glycolate oxidase subunit GlcE [Gammaproteobacteria bacterium]